MINRDRDELAWIRTDIDGEIDALSSAAERLLGVSGLRGHNLFMFFSRDSISVERDARMARTGWPNLGTAVLEPVARRALTIRYFVTAGAGSAGAVLYWFITDASTPGNGAP